MNNFFPNLSDAELVALEDDTINRRIDLCCAEGGIPLWCQEMTEPKAPVAPDFPLYEVGGVFVDDDATAKALASAIQQSRRWKRKWRGYGASELDEWEQDDTEIKVEIKNVYRPETWHKFRADLEQYEERKKAFNEAKRQNKDAYDKRATVANEVWKDISTARERINDDARLRKLFDRYVNLANGDREIARRFLIAAEHFDDNWQPSESWRVPELEAASA